MKLHSSTFRGALGALFACLALTGFSRPQVVSGRYLEARNAAVYAGPCHYGSEVASQGQRALAAWQIERGAWQGTDLAGLALCVAVESAQNFQEAKPRKSWVFVPRSASAAQRRAGVAWLRAEHAAVLGEVQRVEVVDLNLRFDEDRYQLEAGQLQLSGLALADRRCCTMTENLWYAPLADVKGAVVGNSDRCRVRKGSGRTPWAYEGQNQTFVAHFGADGPARR